MEYVIKFKMLRGLFCYIAVSSILFNVGVRVLVDSRIFNMNIFNTVGVDSTIIGIDEYGKFTYNTIEYHYNGTKIEASLRRTNDSLRIGDTIKLRVDKDHPELFFDVEYILVFIGVSAIAISFWVFGYLVYALKTKQYNLLIDMGKKRRNLN